MRLFLQIKSGRILDILWRVFSKTIISLAVVALDKRRLIIANSALRALLAIYLPSHVQSAHVVKYSYLLCISLVILSLRLSLGWCCFEWDCCGDAVSSFTEYHEVVQNTGLKFVP